MTTKITKVLGRIPNILLLAIIAINATVNGWALTLSNSKEAEITHGVTAELLQSLAIVYGGIILTNFVDKIIAKTYKMKRINVSHEYWLKRTLNSKVSDIQKLSTGKLFDSVKEIAILESNMGLSIIWILPAVIPFSALVVREFKENWIMGTITISSLIICTILVLVSDRLFGFEKEAKQKKAIMQEITADNFMNVKTIKFLGVKKFAVSRLLQSQQNAFPYLTRPTQVAYFRIIDIIGTIPLIVNIWLSKNNIDLVAFIVLSEWTLNNMRGNLTNFAEQIVELKAQKEILKDLHGDDYEDDEDHPFESVTLKDVYFDYGKDDNEEDVIFNVKDLTINKGDKILVTGESGEGKAEPYTNKIPTPTEQGYTLMGDLKVGDYVFGENGKKTKVTHIFEQGMRDIYRITFKDHRHIDVSDEHLFGLYHYSHGEYKYKVMSVRELYERQTSQGLHCRYRVPHNNAVIYPKSYMPIHPWVLGCFIGNGCCRETNLTISAATIEVPQRIADICGFTVKRNSLKNYNWVFYKNNKPIRTEDFFVEIPEMINCYSKDKTIPHSYMVTDIQSRYRLLQGLLDTDGNITKDIRHNVSYSSTSKKLCEQILWLLRSLGFTGTITLDKRFYKYNSGFCGRVHFSIPHEVKHYFFSVSYKWQQAIKAFYNHLPTKYRYFENGNIIENIEKLSEKKQCRCIRVENPSHLYLTENFIVTHNSSLANLLAGAITPSSGTIIPTIDVYYVWQETECLADTLRNNILFGNDFNVSDTEILCYFEKLGMMKWYTKKKDGLDTYIGERGCKLSSGQKQRINIIRCLLQMKYHPEQLFIMDEITSNLDTATRALALECFKEAMTDNISAIVISHNDGFEKITNRHIVVKDHKYNEK